LLQMSVRGFTNGVRSPMKVANTLFKYAPGMVKSAKEKITERHKAAKSSIPGTRFNLETSPHRIFDSTSFELNEFRAIRGVVPGCTINDMVLTICSGALRKYLGHHKELPEESLRAFVPINVRSKKGSLGEGQQPGNQISTMAPKLFTSEMSGRMTNVCISNVPGPQIPVYMNGARLVRQMALGPLADRMGLFIAISSYSGELSFSATSCRRTMPDVEFFMECIRVSFDELKTASLEFKAKKKAAEKEEAEEQNKKNTSKKKTTRKKTVSKKKVAKKSTKKVVEKKTP